MYKIQKALNFSIQSQNWGISRPKIYPKRHSSMDLSQSRDVGDYKREWKLKKVRGYFCWSITFGGSEQGAQISRNKLQMLLTSFDLHTSIEF